MKTEIELAEKLINDIERILHECCCVPECGIFPDVPNAIKEYRDGIRELTIARKEAWQDMAHRS